MLGVAEKKLQKILGPFVVRLFFTAGPVDPDLVEPIVEAVIRGLGGSVEKKR